MEKSITVRILGKEYALRVREEDEAMTREIAAYVDDKMSAFKKAFPKQPETTTAVVAALAIAEELFITRERQGHSEEGIDREIEELSEMLDRVIEGR
jgi:cell division protein ZapA